MDATPDSSSPADDLSALAWVHSELRRSLENAHKALRRHLKEAEAIGRSDVDAVDPSVLRGARVQLHQGVGALELVGLPGPARVLRASEAAVQRMVAKPAMVDAAGVEVIERSSFALLDFLGRLLAGKPVSPIALFPQYRAAQTLAGADRIHPADLWVNDWQWQALPPDRWVTPRAADDTARSEMESLVLALMRQPDAAAPTRMSDLCAALGAGVTAGLGAGFTATFGTGARTAPGQGQPHLATLWQLAAAFFEAQAGGLLVADVYSKRIASRLLAQLRMSVTGQGELSERLVQDLLFFCAHARPPTAAVPAPRLAAVRSAWRLDGSAGADYETPRLGRFDPAWLAQARKRIAGAKDLWSAVAGGELHRLGNLAEQFALVGDSLQRLFPSGDRLAQALQSAVAQTVARGEAPPPGLAMEVATGVLCLEASIEDGELDHPELSGRVERLAQRIDDARIGVEAEALEPWMEELYRRVSDRQTMGSVVHELRASLSEVEKQIDQYFRNPAQREVLIPVPGQLSSMRGVLSVLGLEQASQAVLHMRSEVDALAETEVDPQRAAQAGTFDRLADNLGALSFLIDMLSVQPALAKSLFRFDPETGNLSAVMGQSERPSAFAAVEEAAATDGPPPLLDRAQQLADAASEPEVSDTEFGRQLERLSQQAVAADESSLARMMGSAQSALRRATDDDTRQAVRAELAESMARFSPMPALAEPAPAPAPVPPPSPAPVEAGQSGLEDDAEMREIFIEEAREVVEAARSSLERLSDAPDDVGELTALRRAFHTLKGSARMVGLRDFGEGAWACEQLYNARLAVEPRLDAALAGFTQEALAYLGGWTDAIAEGRNAGHAGADLVGPADALRLEGRRVAVPMAGTAAPLAAPPAPAVPATELEPVFELALPALEADAGLDAAAASVIEPGPAPEPEVGFEFELEPPAAHTDTLAARVPDLPSAADLDFATLPAAVLVSDVPPAAAERPELPESVAGDWADTLLPDDATAVAEPVPDATPGLRFELDLGGFDEPPPAPAAEPARLAPTDVDALPPLGEDGGRAVDEPEAEAEPEIEFDLRSAFESESGPAPAGAEVIELDFGDLAGMFDSPVAGPPEVPAEPEPMSLPAEALPEPMAAAAWPESVPDLALQTLAAPPEDGAASVPEEREERAFDLPSEQAAEPEVPAFERLLSPEAVEEPTPASEIVSAPVLEAEPGHVLEVEPEPEPAADDEQVKLIGPLRIGIPLFNIYLNEADELSRRLGTELAEWALEHDHRAVPESAAALAHSLAGSSATVGYVDLSMLSRSLEHALMRSQPAGHSRPGEAALFVEVAEEIRRLLHQFAAGFLRPVAPDLLDRLAELERLPVEPAVDGVDDGVVDGVVDVGLEVPPDGPAVAIATESGWAAEASAPMPLAAPDAFDDEEDLDAVDAIDAELFPIFDEEAEELLPQLQARLRDWADRPSDLDAAAACMRTLHTFKGGARLSGAMRLGEMAHRLETAIEHLLAGEPASPAAIEPLLVRADHMSAALEALRLPAAAAVPDAAQAVERPAVEPTDPAATADVEALPEPITAEPVETLPVPASAEQPARRTPAGPAPAPIDWRRFPDSSLAVAAPSERPAAAAGAAVRVRASLLDRLVNQAGEVSITRARIDADVHQLQASLGELTDSLDRLRRQLRDIELQADTQISSRMEAAKAAAQSFDPLEMDRYTRFQELTRFMAESVNDVATLQRSLQRTLQSTEDELAAQARLTRALQDDLLRTRMVEFESLADRLYRTVRQATKDTGKPVRLDIVGGAIEVDRGVLERMAGPFEHLLRNCVAHGIEAPDQRAAAGKDRSGTITVTVSHEGNEVGVEVRDDGAGLDLGRIRERGVERGLLAADAAVSDADLAQLIFKPGFSTAASVTELAGRGVGLDVVLAEVNAMGGRIETRSVAGQGTSFRLLLPLTTAVTQVVMLRCGELTVAVPSTLIEVVRRVPVDEIERACVQASFTLGDDVLPFYWLGALLQAGSRGPATGRTQAVVVVRSALQRVALHVDEVLGNQEVVVKNLGPQLSRLPGLAGVTLLPSGAVALIYNPVALATLYGDTARQRMQQATRADEPVAAAAAPALAPLVLVVDDSLTVRRVTQRLLLREGYRVTLAKDGMDALERLAEERPAVMLSDIEMPRMDGFDLVRNVRADERLAGLPVIMISSRIAQKHRDYAAELGVDHYLGKPFAEDELLSLVARYVVADVTT